MLLEPWTYEDGHGFEVTIIPEAVNLKATILRKMVRLALSSPSGVPQTPTETPTEAPAAASNQQNSRRAYVGNSEERTEAARRSREEKAAEATAKKHKAEERVQKRELEKCRGGIARLKAKQLPVREQMISLLLLYMQHIGANADSVREKRRELSDMNVGQISDLFQKRNGELSGKWPVPPEEAPQVREIDQEHEAEEPINHEDEPEDTEAELRGEPQDIDGMI